ncbi:MAG: inositol monophosphatase family protein [Vicinamibacterales bacterium]
MTAPDPRFLATAIEVVTRAGAIQRARFGSAVRVDKKGAIDLVTEVDVEIERMCRALIAERFPDHDILGEEFGAAGGTGKSHCWVFDPLDGTTNFAHGVPIFCSALALEVDGEAVVGAVFDPNRQELFTAERGIGAWCNGAPIRVSSTAALIDALLVTGFPYDIHTTLDEVIGLFAAFVAKARAIRRLGSAAIDLCWVAAGRMDAFWEERLQRWDTRAGALLVQEAGGRISALDGGPWDPGGGQLLASNGHLHEALCAVVRAHRERRPNKTR